MGRWRRDTLVIAKDDCFWMVNKICKQCMGPLNHMFNFLSSVKKEGADLHLAELVCGKADKIYSEFEDLLDAGVDWAEHLMEIRHAFTPEMVEELLMLGVELTNNFGGSFHRRHLLMLRRLG